MLYYCFGPAITEFITWASGVNVALVSPAMVNPLVAQIPMYAARMTPVAAGIVEAIETGAFICTPKMVAIKAGDLVEWTFMTSNGPVNFAAEAVISNGHLLLKDAVLYPRGADPLSGMSRDIYRGFGTMRDWASTQGFSSLKISGTRAANSTSATLGSSWSKKWDLK